MPGGDDDDDVEDQPPEDIYESKSKRKFHAPHNGKFLALYDDAKHRNLRQEHIYAKCYDRECTFKPELITKNSKVSQNTIKEVTSYVMDKTTETPAVGGIPPQRSVTNSRMAYLSHKDNRPKSKIATLTSVRSQEGQVFERLAK